MTNDLDLGRLLGRREAFAAIAARCTAADAATLRQIRDEKLYLSHSEDWEGFCRDYLHTSKPNANRLIRLLEEFGPSYFEVAQLTRISAATYRAIAPSIDEQGLHHNGEAIALIPENSARVAAAVADLRKAIPAGDAAPAPEEADAPEAPPPDPLELLESDCRELSARIEQAIPLAHDRRWRLHVTVCSLRDRLSLLALKI